jgi:hypothetical protein
VGEEKGNVKWLRNGPGIEALLARRSGVLSIDLTLELLCYPDAFNGFHFEDEAKFWVICMGTKSTGECRCPSYAKIDWYSLTSAVKERIHLWIWITIGNEATFASGASEERMLQAVSE